MGNSTCRFADDNEERLRWEDREAQLRRKELDLAAREKKLEDLQAASAKAGTDPTPGAAASAAASAAEGGRSTPEVSVPEKLEYYQGKIKDLLEKHPEYAKQSQADGHATPKKGSKFIERILGNGQDGRKSPTESVENPRRKSFIQVLEELNPFEKGAENKDDDQKEEACVISGPVNVQHTAHVGWNPETGFDMQNIPVEWMKLFAKAGVTEEQLKDRDTANYIMEFVSTEIANTRTSKRDAAAAAPEPPRSPVRSPAGRRPLPAPPGGGASGTSPTPGAAKGGPPPPPPLSGMPPPTTSSNPSPREERGDLMAAIRSHKQADLRQVHPPDLNTLTVEEENNLAGALARALSARRGALKEGSDDDEGGEDAEWN